MIKVIDNFLPKPVFKTLLDAVEDEYFQWEWQNDSIFNPHTNTGDGHFKFGKPIYMHPNLNTVGNTADNKYIKLFEIFRNYQEEIIPSKFLVKLKLNLYPNQGKQVKHGRHSDVSNGGVPDPNIITSVFNFHTCNGYTAIEKEDKTEEIVPSVANQIVIFSNAYHYGVTQSDIPRRIVLNMNVSK